MEEFRFHLTLTDQLASETGQEVARRLGAYLAPVFLEQQVVDVVEQSRGRGGGGNARDILNL